MKKTFKSFLTTPFVCLILIISLIALPINASAETGTLGNETPEITFQFTDASGKTANGNRLTAGDYTVDVVLSGMKAVSVIQLKADYSTSVIKSIALTDSYAEAGNMDLKQQFENGSFIVFMVSDNIDTTYVNPDGTVMFTFSVTLASACDFADVFELATSPDKTFIEADYGDGNGYLDCYSLDTTADYTAGKLYPMTADVSPYIAPTEFDINGKISVASDRQGSASETFVQGIKVSVVGTDISAVTDSNGSYTLEDVPAGSYTITISGDTTIDRSVKLDVSGDRAVDYDQINVDTVGVITCDFNKDGKVNSTDALLLSKNASAYCDLNNDGEVDKNDVVIFKTFFNKTVNYTDVTLK
jgi:hypothetical protein